MIGQCCSCHEEKSLYNLRKGVNKCSKCICDQIGRSVMDTFRKALKGIPPPVNVLVCVSGGPNSMFAYHILKSRLNLGFTGKSAVVKRLEAISSRELPIENLNVIHKFGVKEVVEFAKENGFNCVVLGDCVDRVSLGVFGVLSQGRTDLFPWVSGDDLQNYMPIAVLRPVRQCLAIETMFYCRENGIEVIEELSPFQKAFEIETKMIKRIGEEGSEATPFAVQKMAERLASHKSNAFCL